MAARAGSIGAGFALMRAAAPAGSLPRLLVLSFAASLSEGIGLILLAPILVAAQGSNGQSGWFLRAWRDAGLPVTLEPLLLAFVVIVAVRAALVQARALVETRLPAEIERTLRTRLFDAILHAGWRTVSQVRPAELMALSLGTLDRISYALQNLLSMAMASATLATIVCLAFALAPAPSIIICAGGCLALILHGKLRHRTVADGEALGASYTDVVGFHSERYSALRLIKSFSSEQRDVAASDALSRAIVNNRLSYQRTLARATFVLQVGATITLAVAVWLAIRQWNTSVTFLLPLIALFARCVPLLSQVQASWHNWLHNGAAITDYEGIHARMKQAAEPALDRADKLELRHEIVLAGVGVRHADRPEPVLADIDVRITHRSIVFCTGASGSGKSTLADCLGGLIVPDSGRLLVDGALLAPDQLRAWRHQVAYVQQEPILFDATIRENLLWACPGADEATLVGALEAASARFVLDLPGGLDTPVGPAGRQLSGGERQRIVLARALLRRPALLILDEATSALDAANEQQVADAVRKLAGTLTILIIGHRGALADIADRRIRLEAGRIVEDVDLTDPAAKA